MKLSFRCKKIYDKYRCLIFISFMAIIIFLCCLMIKKIVLDFPYKNGQNLTNYYLALSQFFAGVFGGIFTIAGVSLTIFLTNNDRKKDLLKIDKPKLLCGANIKNYDEDNIIIPLLNTIYECDEKTVYSYGEISDKAKKYCNFKPFDIYITSNADCVLYQIIIGESIIYPLKNEYVLKKDNSYTVDFSRLYFSFDDSIPDITICVLSMLEKKYYYTIAGNNVINNDTRGINCYLIDDYDAAERVYNYNKKIEKLENNLELKSNIYINKKLRENRK